MCKVVDYIIFILLIVCGICDWRKKEIPIFLLVVMSAVVGVSFGVCRVDNLTLKLAGVAVGLLFFLISKCTQQAIGYGDSWIFLLLGTYLGVIDVLEILFVASLLASIVSLFFLWKKRWNKKVTLAFVPYLTVAYMGVVFL